MPTNPIRPQSTVSPGILIVGGFGGLLIFGSPFLTLWLSYFVLGRFGPIGQLLQSNSSPYIAFLPAFLVGIVLVGLGWWLGRRTSASVALATQSLGVALLVLNLIAAWSLTLIIMPRFDIGQIPFDRASWEQADCYTSRTRQRMLVDLREQLRGQMREQVIATIGSPTDGRSSYCLGPEAHIIPVDRDFMQPTFNSQGQLVDLKVTGS